jgi:hypothetical protein
MLEEGGENRPRSRDGLSVPAPAGRETLDAPLRIALVPARRGANPQNPFDRLSPGERHGRFMSILAELYREMTRGAKEEEEDEEEEGSDVA